MLDDKTLIDIYKQSSNFYSVSDIYNENKVFYELSINDSLESKVISYLDNGYSIKGFKDKKAFLQSHIEEGVSANNIETNYEHLMLNEDIDKIKHSLAYLKEIDEIGYVTYCNLRYINNVKILKANLSVVSDTRRFNHSKLDILVSTKSGSKKFLSYYLLNNLDDDLKKIADDVKIISQKEVKKTPNEKKYDIIFDPGVCGIIIHEAIGHLMEADYYLLNSFLHKYLNKQIAPTNITIKDYSLKNSNLFGTIDDEGNDCIEKCIVERGVLTDILCSNDYSSLSTPCNARRQSFRYEAIPRMSNTYLEIGNSLKQSIIKDTKECIWVKDCLGGITNPITGEFTINVCNAFLVVDGEITNPIDNITITGNTLDFFNSITEISNDLVFLTGMCGKNSQFIPVTMGSPTIKVENLLVRSY